MALLVHGQAPAANAQSTAGDQNSVTASDDETSDLWFVELASPPTADGTSLAQVRQEKAAFRTAAAAARLQYRERYAFDTLGMDCRCVSIGAMSRRCRGSRA
jgi:hypothetical protein